MEKEQQEELRVLVAEFLIVSLAERKSKKPDNILHYCTSMLGFDLPAHLHSGICPGENVPCTCPAPPYSLSPSRTCRSPCTCPYLCPRCTSQFSRLSLDHTSPKPDFPHTCPCPHLVLGHLLPGASKSRALSEALLLEQGSTSCLGGNHPPTAWPAQIWIN